MDSVQQNCFATIVNTNLMEKENNIHSTQINFTVRRDKENNIIDKNVMINVRTSDVTEAIGIYNELKRQLNGELEFNPAQQSEINNQPESNKLCPQCNQVLVRRKGKDNKLFLGCSSFPKCKHTEAL
jgi:ssDNA-binding Zn-finger/Zn-ribbon topoisomerase 1